MKTFLFGVVLGLFASAAVFLCEVMDWPSWVLFIAWLAFTLLGKTIQGSLSVYLQITLGIGLSVLMQVTATALSELVGPIGLYLSVFLFVGLLPFITKIKGLGEISAWFIGLSVFFGNHPPIEYSAIARLLLPVAAGLLFGWLLQTVMKYLNASPELVST